MPLTFDIIHDLVYDKKSLKLFKRLLIEAFWLSALFWELIYDVLLWMGANDVTISRLDFGI